MKETTQPEPETDEPLQDPPRPREDGASFGEAAAVSSNSTSAFTPDLVVLATSVSGGIVGGIIEYLLVLKKGLPAAGIPVRMVEFPKALNLLESRGLPRIVRIPIHLGFVGAGLLRILRLRRRYPGLLVHSHGASYVLLLAFLARLFGSPAIHTFHSPVDGSSRLLRSLSPKLDGLVFVSRSLYDLLHTRCKVDNLSIRFVPGGVDTHVFSPALPSEKARLRRELLAANGLPDQGHLGVFLGRVAPEKGVVDLVEAAGRLKALGCPISLLVAGSALDSRDGKAFLFSVNRRIRDLRLEDSVALIGPVAHPLKERLLAAADVVLCPSRWEASPMVVVEALASGVPVVAYRVGGLEERIRDGETGFLVERGNVSQIADAVDRLTKSDSLRAEMGHRAREEASHSYAASSLVARHIELYSSIRLTDARYRERTMGPPWPARQNTL